jgi:hypothetical protein
LWLDEWKKKRALIPQRGKIFEIGRIFSVNLFLIFGNVCTFATLIFRQMEKQQEVPEFIQGLATKKSEAQQRRKIVEKEYNNLLDRLAKRNGKNKKFVRNHFLNVDVWFVMREGGLEARNRSTFNWQSSYAILHLETIVKEAIANVGEPIYVKPKASGKQKEHNYANMAVLYYKFEDTEKSYLNFTVRLILGVKNDGTHIQYSVNKVEVIEQK